MLKAAKKDWKSEEIPRGASDVRDETILDFCFRRNPMRDGGQCSWHGDATNDTLELWLNFVSVSEDFLQRFVQVRTCENKGLFANTSPDSEPQ